MAPTREDRETVMARIKRGRKFARIFYAGAIEMLLDGEAAEALSRLRDLVHAFKESDPGLAQNPVEPPKVEFPQIIRHR